MKYLSFLSCLTSHSYSPFNYFKVYSFALLFNKLSILICKLIFFILKPSINAFFFFINGIIWNILKRTDIFVRPVLINICAVCTSPGGSLMTKKNNKILISVKCNIDIINFKIASIKNIFNLGKIFIRSLNTTCLLRMRTASRCRCSSTRW